LCRLVCVGYFCALVARYAVQVRQTKYLIEIGFTPLAAAWVLGVVSVVGIPGQIGLGAMSDRVGRGWVWTVGRRSEDASYLGRRRHLHHPREW